MCSSELLLGCGSANCHTHRSFEYLQFVKLSSLNTTFMNTACVMHGYVCCCWLQLWGTIDSVEAPGPSELVQFKANDQARQATAADELQRMGQQVRDRPPKQREPGRELVGL